MSLGLTKRHYQVTEHRKRETLGHKSAGFRKGTVSSYHLAVLVRFFHNNFFKVRGANCSVFGPARRICVYFVFPSVRSLDTPNISAIFSHGSRKYFFVTFANNSLFVMELFSRLYAFVVYFKYCACMNSRRGTV